MYIFLCVQNFFIGDRERQLQLLQNPVISSANPPSTLMSTVSSMSSSWWLSLAAIGSIQGAIEGAAATLFMSRKVQLQTRAAFQSAIENAPSAESSSAVKSACASLPSLSWNLRGVGPSVVYHSIGGGISICSYDVFRRYLFLELEVHDFTFCFRLMLLI